MLPRKWKTGIIKSSGQELLSLLKIWFWGNAWLISIQTSRYLEDISSIVVSRMIRGSDGKLNSVRPFISLQMRKQNTRLWVESLSNQLNQEQFLSAENFWRGMKVSIISLFLVIIVISMLLMPIVILMIFFGILTKLLSLISTSKLDLKTDSLNQEMPTNQSQPSLLNSRVIILCLVAVIMSSIVTMCTMRTAEMNQIYYEDSSTSGVDSTPM